MSGFKYVIRAIQSNARTKQQVESLLTKLLEFLPTILRIKNGHMFMPEILGIGINWPEYQPKVFQSFVEAMSKDDEDKLSMFKDILLFHSTDGEFSPIGINVLKAMWSFSLDTKKPLLRSVYKTDSELLVKAACSNKKILDTMVSSPDTPPSVAHKLVSRLANYIKQMAKDQYGSYFVEKLYEKSDVKRKEKIIKNLAEIHPQLNTTPFGRVLIVKTHLDQYRNNPKFWQKSVKKDSVDRRSFVEVANLEKKKHHKPTTTEDGSDNEPETKKSKKAQTNQKQTPKNLTQNNNQKQQLTASQAAFLSNLKSDLTKRKTDDTSEEASTNKRKETSELEEEEPQAKKQKTKKSTATTTTEVPLKKKEKQAVAEFEHLRLKKQLKIERNRIQSLRRKKQSAYKNSYQTN